MNLYSPTFVKEGLRTRGLSMQKKFGQNFLISEPVAAKIADAAAEGAQANAVCFEIGPGIGALTEKLCERFSAVTAIEIDRGVFPWLSENLARHENLTLKNDDALACDFPALAAPFAGADLRACANLPYSITSPAIIKLCECGLFFSSLTLMIQKEAALRLCASPGDENYGSLSAYLAYYGQTKRLFDVRETNFFPRPTVTSTVIRITPYREKPVKPQNETLFFALIRAAFSARRKTIRNCVSTYFSLSREATDDALLCAGIDPARRGETLSLTELCALSDALCAETQSK